MVLHKDINRIELLKKISFEFPNGKGAEIGTFKGEFAKEILQNWGGTLYMIDVWRPLGGEYLDASNHAVHSTAYSETMNNISGYEDRGIMVRATSEIAADMFGRESLDFVYIDANHAYDFVVQDIKLWYPKVKSGGYLCGHDYININWYDDPNFLENKKDKHIWNGNFYHGVFGVNPAVDEFCKKFNFDLAVTKEWFGSWMIKK
jgi:cephalosporin hydroxylase